MTPANQCVACNATQRTPPAREPTYFTCPRCGTIALRPLPAEETNEPFEGETSLAKYSKLDRQRRRYFAARLAMITGRARLRPGVQQPRLLEIGCSTGELLRLAQRNGWHADGIEMSAALANEARRKNPQSRIYTGDFLRIDIPQGDRYHAIAAIDVIEHVLDPAAFLARARAFLHPRGLILVQTPNARSLRARILGPRWDMLRPEYHFHLFSPTGIRALLHRNGFRILTLRTASGTGRETGPARIAAAAKEALLNPPRLGNALLLLAQHHNPRQS